jgi:uncharacterized membrane protein
MCLKLWGYVVSISVQALDIVGKMYRRGTILWDLLRLLDVWVAFLLSGNREG